VEEALEIEEAPAVEEALAEEVPKEEASAAVEVEVSAAAEVEPVEAMEGAAEAVETVPVKASLAEEAMPVVAAVEKGPPVPLPAFPDVLAAPALPLSRKSRLDRPLPPCLLQGPLLQLSLPSSVLQALLADPLTQRSLCQHLSVHSRKNRKAPLRTPAPLLSPHCSVLHLLESLLERCWKEEPQSQEEVQLLQRLFERLLPVQLLLPEERAVFAARIDQLRGSKKLLATDFGPYHFLRLLVWVVLLVEEYGEEVGRLQRVLDAAVRLLDEQAHTLFY